MEASNFIFKRYSAENKKKFINEMTQAELMRVSYDIIERCVKEAGHRIRPEHTPKSMVLDRDLASNHWNSHIDRIFEGKIYKKDKKNYLILDCYIQGDDTDTNDYYPLKDFINFRYDQVCVGKLHEEFSNGYSHEVPANYDRIERAEVIQAILLAYVNNKYK